MGVEPTDCIQVDNKKIQLRQNHLYFVLNKPKGYVCSKRRLYPKQKLIYDLFENQGLFTVGRLDKDTTGLILVTTDGLLSQKIIHPSSCIQKHYLVKVQRLEESSIAMLKKGIFIDGVHVIPKRVEQTGPNVISIVVMEGKNREIRRLCKKAGLEIESLQRTRIGQLSLNGLKIGDYQKYKKESIYRLFDGQKSLSASK